MTAPATPRVLATLRSPEMLQDAMEFSRLNVRQLAEACGKTQYRSMIGHLRSGHSTSCSVHLATRIEYVLRLAPRSLFYPTSTSTGNIDISRTSTRKVAA